jgi:hypothetical protein
MHRSIRASSLAPSSILILLLLTSLAVASDQANPASTPVNFTLNSMDSGDYATNTIISGDFNNDGILDLVTVNATSLSFYKGLGGGKFAPAAKQTLTPNYAAGGAIFAADFNGDGKLDLAVSYGYPGGDSVIILLGNGNGTFTQGTNITVSGVENTIALADFNGDHKPDIAISSEQDNLTWIYLGNGDGTFKLSDTLTYGGLSLVAGDFNADGKQDLAFSTGNGSSTVGMFLGNGNGTFGSPILATLNFSLGLAVGDFYNNRIQTLAALGGEGGSGNVYIYSLQYSNGQLLVQNQTLIGDFSAGGPYDITGGDLNGDFLFDVFVSGGSINSAAFSAYMLGNGNGTFQALQYPPNNNAGIDALFPFIRDLNYDSRHDAGLAWNSSDISGAEVLINTNATTNCDPPPANKLSVHICAPTSGKTVGKTFTFRGAGNAFSGIAKRMELWIDGKKIGEDLEDQLKITTTLTAGSHTASFVVVDSFDNYTSQSVTFTSTGQ